MKKAHARALAGCCLLAGISLAAGMRLARERPLRLMDRQAAYVALVRAARLLDHTPALRAMLRLPARRAPAAVPPAPFVPRGSPLELPGVRFSTYLGGSDVDLAGPIAVDAAGYVYVAGTTTSADFPTRNPLQPYRGGLLIGADVFVAKLSPDGDSLVYATYLGGGGEDLVSAIAVDDLGRVYLAGGTASPDFPARNALQPYRGGGRLFSDAFVVRLSADGRAVEFATCLGGDGDETATALALGDDGSVYVAGTTTSGDFPTSTGAFQPARADTSAQRGDAFVARLRPDGESRFRLGYATYLGGSWDEAPLRLAADPEGRVWITGFTNSDDFPTREALQDTFAGPGREQEGDAFLARLDAEGASLDFSTYLGGRQDDQGTGLALDEAGHVYLTGWTASNAFPTTPGAYQTERRGLVERFVMKLAPDGAGWRPVFSTRLGASGAAMGVAGLAVDPAGRVWIAGATSSDALPTLEPAQAAYGGGASDAFLARMDDGGARLGYATFLGGSRADLVTGVALGDSAVCITGGTGSEDFPTHGALQAAFDGPAAADRDLTGVFVACFDLTVGKGVAVEEPAALPKAFALHQSYPNPFNPQTTIPFDVRDPSRVTLAVYDLQGRRLATLVDGTYAPGRHEVRFDGRGLPSGTYFYVIEMRERDGAGRAFRAVKKMVLLR